MTEEEYKEKERLIADDMASISNRVRHAFNQGYELGRKSVRENAKLKETIRKVKEEIDKEAEYYGMVDRYIGVNKTFAIIERHTEGLV